jgi:dTDP-4-dehydrorhamnose 3,5-epimerase
MIPLPTKLPGLILMAPEVHRDERGFFVETFRLDQAAALGVTTPFVQENHARTGMHTLRGLHFQHSPGQAKLVRVASGSILDVVVDIRRSSAAYGKAEMIELNDVDHHQLFIPVGFAHGYLVTSQVADVCYKVTSYYDASAERGIAWDDPALDLAWPIGQPNLSERDRSLPNLSIVERDLPAW